ncbi:Uncharacterized protein HZ326_17350 [Fusarium oxysporum f. sp. albedinis]|nr:Uncharacterized protein HZ326_17350 [Fusarium oxysporum f. sp. albedinis]
MIWNAGRRKIYRQNNILMAPNIRIELFALLFIVWDHCTSEVHIQPEASFLMCRDVFSTLDARRLPGLSNLHARPRRDHEFKHLAGKNF